MCKILLVTLSLLSICFSSISKIEACDFRKTSWEMTKEQVKEAEKPLKQLNEDENMVVFKGSIMDMPCGVIYSFVEDKLYSAMYLIETEHTNKNDYIDDFTKLKELLIIKYGKPIEDISFWKNDLYKDNPQHYGIAISLGHLFYRAKWRLESTEITEILRGDKFKIDLAIAYDSIKLEELAKGVNQKKQMNDL